MYIIQIGANRGNDDVSKIIGNNQPSKLILVEPMQLHNTALNEYYNWITNLYIENVVIDVNNSNKLVEFFYHIEDAPNYELACLDVNHFKKHPYAQSTDGIRSFFIQSININDLFIKHNLTYIDILFIDAEGQDDTIIKSIQFDKFEIKNIYFENLHIKDKNIYNFLESKGYVITMHTGHGGWTSLAKKNN